MSVTIHEVLGNLRASALDKPRDVDDPRDIPAVLARAITMLVETMKVVEPLPELTINGHQ